MTDNEPPAKRQRADDDATPIETTTTTTTTTTAAAADIATATDTDNDTAAVAVDPMEAIMPLIPGVPPVAPKEERRIHRAEKTKWWTSKLGMAQPELVYCAADYALWPEQARELFKAVKTNTDDKQASEHMRNWFAEHEGMPRKAPTCVRSAYFLYSVEQKKAISETRTYQMKKDGKKIGANWKKLSQEERQPYLDKFTILKSEREANVEWREKKMAEWNEERGTSGIE